MIKQSKGDPLMAAATTTREWHWSADVLDFASKHNVAAYLDPLLLSTRQIFPTARQTKVSLEVDPEIRDDWHIVFDVEVPREDVPNYVDAQHQWIRALYAICPAPLVCTFRLLLVTL
jgi:hypothetical protein